MAKTLKAYCPFCGINLTEKTITEINQHFQKDHNITILDAVYAALQNTIENELVETDS